MHEPPLYGPTRRGGPLPLLIGLRIAPVLTGDQLARLKRRLNRLLCRRVRACPHTPLVLLCALSGPNECEIVAAALNEVASLRLVVARACPEGEFLNSLAADAAKAAAQDLLRRAERVFVPAAGTDPVTTYPQILVQVGDCRSAAADGRAVASAGIDKRGKLTWDERSLRSSRRLFEQLDDFNRNALCCVGAAAHYRSKEDLLPGEALLGLPTGLRVTAAALRDWYAVPDTLALHFQARKRLVVKLLFVMSLLAASCARAFLSLPGDGWLASTCYFGGCLLTILTFWSGWQRYGDRHVMARALAEGLRVQLFWLLGGVREATADHYLHGVRHELDWVPLAVRNWLLLAERGEAASDRPQDAAARLELVLTYWIRGQIDYFSRAIPRIVSKERGLKWSRYGAFALVALWAALRGWARVAADVPDFQTWVVSTFHLGPRAAYYWGLVDVILPVWLCVVGSLLYYFGKTWLLARQRTRYQEMLREHERELIKLRGLADTAPEKVGEELVRLGKRALEENGFWVENRRLIEEAAEPTARANRRHLLFARSQQMLRFDKISRLRN